MRLTLHADYALRVLLYLASHPDRPVSTQEIGTAYGISKNHLVRVVQRLNQEGYVTVTPGRLGGTSLSRPAREINAGAVVRSMETNLAVVECFDPTTNTCVIASACLLKGVLQNALGAFLAVLDGYTLEDLASGGRGKRLAAVFAGQKNKERKGAARRDARSGTG